MNYLDVALYLLDGHIEKLVDAGDAVGETTGSEAARVGALAILLPISFLSVAAGLLMLVAAAPFYAAWAIAAMAWICAKHAWRLVVERNAEIRRKG